MNLKDQIAADIDQVFMDTNEFADTVMINGVGVRAIWDNETLNYRIRSNCNNLVIGDALFFITKSEWDKVPRVSHPPRTDEALMIDRRNATIMLFTDTAGLYEITITYTGAKR